MALTVGCNSTMAKIYHIKKNVKRNGDKIIDVILIYEFQFHNIFYIVKQVVGILNS